jgi:hypothetical protein
MRNSLTVAARAELARCALITSAGWDDMCQTQTLNFADWHNLNDTPKHNEQAEQNNPAPQTLELNKPVQPDQKNRAKPNQLIDINPFSNHNLEQGNWATFDLKLSVEHIDKKHKKEKILKSTDLSIPLTFKKKSIQPRFSRRRYLREYNTLNLMPLLLTLTGFISVLIIAMVINLGILLPGTHQNRAKAENILSLEQTMATLKPEFQALSAEQEQLKNQANQSWMSFPVEGDVRHQLIAFIDMLGEDRSVQLIDYDIITTPAQPELDYLTLNMKIKTGFINWMEYRDLLNSDFMGIRVITETITAPPRQNLVNISTSLHIPFRNQQAG